MSRNRRRRTAPPWGIFAIGALVGILPLLPLPFELLDRPASAVPRMILIGPMWLALGIGVVLRFNVARVAVQWLLRLQVLGGCILYLCFLDRQPLSWFIIHTIASLGILQYLRRADVRAAFTGEEFEPAVVELEPIVAVPDPEPDSTAIFRDPSRSDRYNTG